MMLRTQCDVRAQALLLPQQPNGTAFRGFFARPSVELRMTRVGGASLRMTEGVGLLTWRTRASHVIPRERSDRGILMLFRTQRQSRERGTEHIEVGPGYASGILRPF